MSWVLRIINSWFYCLNYKDLFQIAFRTSVSTVYLTTHYVKRVQIRSFLWSVFIPNMGKYGPEKTLYLDTFRAVIHKRKTIQDATFQLQIFRTTEEEKLQWWCHQTQWSKFWWYFSLILNSFIRSKRLSWTIWSIFRKGLDFSNVASLLSLNHPKISARKFSSIFVTIFVWNKC